MKRLTDLGGRSLRAFAIGLMLISPLAANAADDSYTDRIIVKYRTTPSNAMAQASQVHGADLSAQKFGVVMNRVRTTALGSQVLKLDRRIPADEAARLAADIAASDPDVEYAEPDRMMHRLMTPNDTRYNE